MDPIPNAHTNMTDITGVLDILWQNNISPDNS
jgi:hypothetical protein